MKIFQNTGFLKYSQNRARKAKGLLGKHEETSWWKTVFFLFQWFLGIGDEIQADYVEQLKEVIQEIENSGIFQTDPKKR